MSEPPPSAKRRPLSVPGFDPQAQPVVPLPALLPLAPACLDLRFIKAAFASPVSWQVEPVFHELFVPSAINAPGIKPAAVFVPLIPRETGLSVLFTRRASHLYHHAGQISFPGGRIEDSDPDPVHAALRETHEEIGVEPRYVQLIGTQPAFLTTTQYAMTPVVGVLQPGYSLVPNACEVAEIFEVPLSVLMDPRLHRLHQVSFPDGGQRHYFSITWQSYFIWGATAALIRNLYHQLAATQQAVQLNQPANLR
jgi:8-oxo-dGTP pyrophosphatase MutT (NUDIX family)